MTPITHARFIGCPDCGAALRIQPPGGWAAEADVEAAAEQQQFLATHGMHGILELHRTSSDVLADRPLWDPAVALAFELTDGMHTYVTTASRAGVDGPREYHISRGALEVENSVAIDDSDLRRGLDREFFPHALRPTKLDSFIAMVQRTIAYLNPDELEIAFDDAADPEVSIARLPDRAYAELLAQCTEIFESWELEHVRHFMQENRDSDGLLAVRVRRHIHISEPLPLAAHSPA